MADDTLKKVAKLLNSLKSGEEESKAQLEKERRDLVTGVAKQISDSLTPTLKELASQGKTTRQDLMDAVSQIKVNVSSPDVNIPPFPEVKVPEPRVTVSIPPVKVPDVIMPEEMNVRGWVSLMGVDLNNPLPVQLRDEKGNPVKLFENITSIVSGGGGGKHDFFTIKGFSHSAYADYINSDNRLRVSVETGSTGLTDAELRASSVPVEQVSGSTWSTYITGANGTIAASIVDSSGVQYSGSNPVPVVITSGATATTAVQNLNADGLYRDTFPVEGTVAVSSVTSSVGATILDGEGLMKTTWAVSDITSSVQSAIIDSSGVQYSGTNPLPVWIATGSGNSVASALIDSTGIQYSGSNPVPVSGTVVVSSVTNTVGANVVDSSGVAYTTTNPLPVGDAGGSITIDGSVAVSGVTGSIGATILNGEGLARDSWLVSDITASVKTALIDSSGVQYSGSNPIPITSSATIKVDIDKIAGATTVVSGGSEATALRVTIANDSTGLLSVDDNGSSLTVDGTVTVSSVTASTQCTIIDSSGVGYSGTNPVPVIMVAGSVSSTVVVGATASDSADAESAPVKIGGIARTANPTAVGAGDAVSATYDDVGRQLIRPVQVRDLLATAYASLVSGSGYGTETALLAGVSGEFHDLVYLMGSNTSDVAVTAEIRASTGGTVITSLRIPANGTAGVALPVPIPAPFADQTWTVDLPDETGGNVYVSALFSKEV